MNQNLWSRVLEFLKRKMWNRRWQRAATCLAAVAVFGVTYALVLPAITMTKEYPTLEAEETLVWSGEEMTVKVSAASLAGEAGKTVVLIADGEGADLSASYAFNEEGICVITDEAGKEIELHRSIREGKKNLVDYWFQLEANEETAFTLQLTDKVDPNRFAETVKAVKENGAEEDKATASNAVPAAAAVIAGPTASSSNAQKASASNATGSNADVAEANALTKSGDELIVTEVDDDGKFVEILDGAVINDLEAEEDDDGEQTEIVAELKFSAGIGEDYEAAVKDAEKNADKRGDAEIKLRWKDVIAQKSNDTELRYEGDGVSIAVYADELAGVPEGSVLQAAEVDPASAEYAEYFRRTKEALAVATGSNAGRVLADARFFDMELLDPDGAKVDLQTAVKVLVTFDETAVENDNDFFAIEFTDDGEKAFKNARTQKDALSFNTASISGLGIAETALRESRVLTASGKDYTITLSFGPEAGVPKASELMVSEVPAESEVYKDYVEKAAAALGDENVPAYMAFTRIFDLSIQKDGAPVVPEAAAAVQIEYEEASAQKLENLKGLSFSGGIVYTPETKVVEAEKDRRRIEFAADSITTLAVTEATKQKDLGKLKAQYGSYTIQLKYDDESVIPEDAVLQITEFEPSEEQREQMFRAYSESGNGRHIQMLKRMTFIKVEPVLGGEKEISPENKAYLSVRSDYAPGEGEDIFAAYLTNEKSVVLDMKDSAENPGPAEIGTAADGSCAIMTVFTTENINEVSEPSVSLEYEAEEHETEDDGVQIGEEVDNDLDAVETDDAEEETEEAAEEPEAEEQVPDAAEEQ